MNYLGRNKTVPQRGDATLSNSNSAIGAGGWLRWIYLHDRMGVYISLLFIVGAGATAIVSNSDPTLDLVFQVAIWACLASAWNIIGGFGGQLSLGHAVFYGLGAYGTALTIVRTDLPAVVGVLFGAACAIVAGVVVALASLRLRGPFFAMATFVMGIAFETIAVNLAEFTGGAFGIPLPITSGAWYQLTFEDRRVYPLLAIGLLIVITLVVFRIRYSRFGLHLIAARTELYAARSFGVSVVRTRVTAMCISAFFTALAGALQAAYLLLVTPDDYFGFAISIEIIFIAIIGGIGTVAGPFIGAAIYIPLEQFINQNLAGGVRGLTGFLLGLVLFLVVVLAPSGVMGGLRKASAAIRGRLLGRTEEKVRVNGALDDE